MLKLLFTVGLLPVLLTTNRLYPPANPQGIHTPGLVPATAAPAAAAGSGGYSLYTSWNIAATGLSADAFAAGLKGYHHLAEKGMLRKKGVLVIADFSKSSAEKRLFVFNMQTGRLLLRTVVAHGQLSGDVYASRFSNSPESYQSSLGFYVTLGTYTGQHGYSLKLMGCEKGINDQAYSRNIVIHGAPYMNADYIRSKGYAGRSHGCPAVPETVSTTLINLIKNGACFFVYHPSNTYTGSSKILNG